MNDTTAAKQQELETRLKAFERLVKLFKPERVVYLIVTTFSALLLLSCAVFLLIQNRSGGSAGMAAPLSMFGSSGVIVYTANRLLRMWNQALQLLAIESETTGG